MTSSKSMGRTRKASLRVSHRRDCANRQPRDGKTPDPSSPASLKGCTCEPTYFVQWREDVGGRERVFTTSRVSTRAEADELLVEKQNDLYKGRSGDSERVKHITFPEWVDAWAEILELAKTRDTTQRTYARSVDYARESFGHLDLRSIGNDELRRLIRDLRAVGMSDVTVSKHLRHLSVCLSAAIPEQYLDFNPIGRFRSTFNLNAPQSEANYFTDAELQRLWQQLRAGLPRPDGTLKPVPKVYPNLFRFAVTTGARLGELLALRWNDVRLEAGEHGELRITKSVNDQRQVTGPKTRSSTRDVHLTADARRVLEEWAQQLRDLAGSAALDDGALVFPSRRGGYLHQSTISSRVLNPAMVAAGIPKIGDESPEPRSFHTFRHCYARLMLEPPAGSKEPRAPLQWVSTELGHSSTSITETIYGHWNKQAKRETAATVPAGAFPV